MGRNCVVGISMELRENRILILIVKQIGSAYGAGWLVVVDFASRGRYDGIVTVPWMGFYHGY